MQPVFSPVRNLPDYHLSVVSPPNMDSSELKQIPVAYVADPQLGKCLNTVLTFLSNPCQGKNYWLDFAWLTTAILFPRAKLKFIPVPFYYPQNLSYVADPSSEFGYVFSHPEALMTPLYFIRTAERLSWHPKATFIGPFLFEPMAMLHRDDILPSQIAIKRRDLLILACLTILACLAGSLVSLARRKKGTWNSVNVACGGLLCAALLSLMETYTVVFFTNYQRLLRPITDIDDLVRKAAQHDLRVFAPPGIGR